MSAIPTSRGEMTAGEISDYLKYCSYRANRGYGVSAEALARFFGDIPGEEMERRYRAEQEARK